MFPVVTYFLSIMAYQLVIHTRKLKMEKNLYRSSLLGTWQGLSASNRWTGNISLLIFQKDTDKQAGMSKTLNVILFCWSLCCSVVLASLGVCSEPKKIGPCRASIPRYFYNTATCKCDKFYWGGCDANGNNFDDLTVCRSTCELPMPSNPVCSLPQQSVLCKESVPRWWFNSASCMCEKFVGGKCGANDNNFETEAACQSQCGCYNCDVCRLPIKPHGEGLIMCMAYIPSFGFNSKTCQCESFIYSGCGGNANRFSTLAECNERCASACDTQSMCELPADPGPCEAIMPRYFYNTKTCQCEKFNWGGCGGNSNNYLSKEDCLSSCKGFGTCDTNPRQCYLPEDPGPCKALMERFHYDPLDCKCKKFNYGGCQSNDNNFESSRKCKNTCGQATCPICNLPKVPGPCKGSFQRYFYNVQTCQCEAFVYGGCGGNENRFDSLEECQGICGSLKCPICNLPSARGPCKAKLTRWYFDAADCQCKTFVYGGCGGNMNRFLTKTDCEGSCGTYPCPVCTLPKKVGPCKAAIRRWYYNPQKNRCRRFSWGGCQPNGNNFKSRKLCNKVCKDFA